MRIHASGRLPMKPRGQRGYRVALERRIRGHHNLVKAFEQRANGAGLSGSPCLCSQYADALFDGDIFEMKTISVDEVPQVRAAIGQLYHYMFIHRNISDYENPNLYAVLDRKLDVDLQAFVVNSAHVGVIWFEDGEFDADPKTKYALPWLFK
jgi:hypothetical protein